MCIRDSIGKWGWAVLCPVSTNFPLWICVKSLIYNEKRAHKMNPFSSLMRLIFVMLAPTNEALRDAQTTYTVLISNIKLVFAYWPLPDIGQIALSGTFSPLPFDYKDAFFAGTSSLNRLPLLNSYFLLKNKNHSSRSVKQKVENYPPVQPAKNYSPKRVKSCSLANVKSYSPTNVKSHSPVQQVKNYASNTAT